MTPYKFLLAISICLMLAMPAMATRSVDGIGVDTVELRKLTDKGHENGIVNLNQIDNTKTVQIVAVVENQTTGQEYHKRVGLFPDASTTFTDNGNVVRHTKTAPSPQSTPVAELYYGYQKSHTTPWEKYYKVESCSNGMCRVVKADFATKTVWIEFVPEASLSGVINDASIPGYGDLP